jgi:hypothetical protein
MFLITSISYCTHCTASTEPSSRLTVLKLALGRLLPRIQTQVPNSSTPQYSFPGLAILETSVQQLGGGSRTIRSRRGRWGVEVEKYPEGEAHAFILPQARVSQQHRPS